MTSEEAMAQALLHGYDPAQGHITNAPLVLAALAAAGYVVVPAVASEKMDRAGHEAWEAWEGDGDTGLHQTACECIYSAMLAAAK